MSFKRLHKPTPSDNHRKNEAFIKPTVQARLKANDSAKKSEDEPILEQSSNPKKSISKKTQNVESKERPNSKDKQQLLEFELYIAALKLEKQNALDRAQQRTNNLIGPSQQTYEEGFAEVRRLITAGKNREALQKASQLDGLKNYLDSEKEKMMTEVWQISNAISEIKKEKKGYKSAMEHAVGDEPIIWHSSQIGSGWLPRRLSVMQKSAEASPFFQMGYRAGTYYGRLRREGSSLKEAVNKVTLLTLGDLTGITAIAESISGRDIAFDEKLSTEDRILRGVLGIIGVVTLAKVGGPRINGFLKKVSGTKVRLMQPKLHTSMGSIGGGGFAVLVGDGAVLALSRIELQILAANGLLSASAMSKLNMSAKGDGKPVSGLKNARTGKYRGGGGSAEDRAYAKQVTGNDLGTYIDDLEFDGHDTSKGRKVLLDAKRSSGKGSWYDMSETDKFAIKFKQGEVLKQAKAQVLKISRAGATHIEWHISHEHTVFHMRNFLNKNGIPNSQIKVIYTPFK